MASQMHYLKTKTNPEFGTTSKIGISYRGLLKEDPPSGFGYFHSCLMVTLNNEHFIMDTGFGRRSPRLASFLLLHRKVLFTSYHPEATQSTALRCNIHPRCCSSFSISFSFLSRYPLRFSFTETEDVECCEGERYRLEVSPTVFTLFEQLSDDSWFPLYAFPRDTTKNQPRTVTREETEQMFEELYTSKETITIRDVKMCINLQTVDSRINFMSHGESHTLKVIRKGKKVQEEIFKTQEEMFERVRQLNVKALGP